MQFQLQKNAEKRRLDMTPMIDCVFQLLLFFLVASNFQEQARTTGEGELGASLPSVTSAMPVVMKPREKIVNLDADGKMYLDGQLHTEQQLASRLQRAQTDNPGNTSVVIRGDEEVDWKYVARVMGLCNDAKIPKPRLAVLTDGQPNGTTGGPTP